ncbi:MAG: metallophosphoesterase family protein [Armatimonadetes bacterium]|nr:metallophosphoesterase family protein [Armatimonadota bacterium]
MSIFAVGDIHGHLDKLKSLIGKLPLASDDKLVFLGDYIDRGPDSKRVISFLLKLKEQYDCVFICGNHEHMMRDYAKGCLTYDSNLWFVNGGVATLRSYDLIGAESGNLNLPDDHWDLISSLRYYHREPGFVFVHGGLSSEKPVEKNVWRDFLWPRTAFTLSRYKHPEGVVIFGHTPFDEPLVEDNKIGIDTGCCDGGPLTAVRLPEFEFYSAL